MTTESKKITTNKVLEMTLMSKFNLHRIVKNGTFPAPVAKDGLKNLYDESAVLKWIDDNPEFIEARMRFLERRVSKNAANIFLNSTSMEIVRKAAQLLDCEIEPFIIDAAVWKARYILDRTTH